MNLSSSPQVAILGSTNWDISMFLPELPRPGHTVGAGRLVTNVGGKGANQAIACHLAGVSSQFVSCIGDDESAAKILQIFKTFKLDVASFFSIPDIYTGTACIFVDARGQNCIGLTPGANSKLTRDVVQASQHLIQDAKVLLMQLEIPIDSIMFATELAKRSGTLIILNPAPAQFLPESLYRMIDILTPNRSELAILSGVSTNSDDGLKRASSAMLTKGVKRLIVTLGSDGVLLASEAGIKKYTAFKVNTVDTTAAGDVFNGYLAAELSNRLPEIDSEILNASIARAIAASAITVTKEGAIRSIPSGSEVTHFEKNYFR